MTPTARTTVVVALLLLVARPSSAQTAGPSLPGPTSKLHTGDVVDVATLDGEHEAGRVVALSPASITILSRSGRSDIPSSQVARIVVKDSVRNGALIGLAVGTVPGVIGAWALGSLCANEGANCDLGAALLVGLGAGAGAAIGAGADGLHHAVVYDIGARVSHEYTPQFFGAAGVTRLTAGGGAGLHIPLDVAGGWGVTAANGVGFEVQTSRSAMTSSTKVNCVKTNSVFIAGPQAGTCVGSGTQAVDRLSTVSGQIVYTFGKFRVRPFASGGLAAYGSTTTIPFATRAYPAGPATVYQATMRQTGLAFVAGGGVKLPLNDHITIRPEISWMSDLQHQWNTSGVKMALAYHW